MVNRPMSAFQGARPEKAQAGHQVDDRQRGGDRARGVPDDRGQAERRERARRTGRIRPRAQPRGTPGWAERDSPPVTAGQDRLDEREAPERQHFARSPGRPRRRQPPCRPAPSSAAGCREGGADQSQLLYSEVNCSAARRCFMPSEKPPTRCVATAPRPTSSSIWVTRARPMPLLQRHRQQVVVRGTTAVHGCRVDGASRPARAGGGSAGNDGPRPARRTRSGRPAPG